MIEFTGHLRGSTDRKSGTEVAREGAKMEIVPETPVLHVLGSERYHLNRQCKKLEDEENAQREKGIAPQTIGRLFGQMNKFNQQFQDSSIKLNDTGKLELCPECDEKRSKTVPEKVPLEGR